jgi:hypothetical protein
MLRKIRGALKPDGRLVLLEYRKEDPKVPIKLEHKMSVDEVKTEVEAEGFKLDKTVETLPRQHILFFRLGGPQAFAEPLLRCAAASSFLNETAL